ncbi:hypothetical protein BBPAJBFB_004207 [Escherichia coli]|nr:hypothetical protein [Escherichia coli]CUQ95613.1 hypothetical protein BN1843_9420 [Escherichia coli]
MQVSNGRTQTEIELILCNSFEVLGFISNEVISKYSHILGFRIGSGQVNVVSVIFQTCGPNFCIFTGSKYFRKNFPCINLSVGTIRFRISCTDTESFVFIGSRETEAITVTFSVVIEIATIVFALVLSSKVQTINQTKEVVVTIGCNTSCTLSHEHVGLSPSVTTEFWQDVSPRTDVVCYTVVTAVIDGAVVTEFQASEGKTGFIFGGTLRFSAVAFEFIFPLTETSQLIVDLGFTFEAKTGISSITIICIIRGEVVLSINFPVQIQLVTVFIINFSCLSRHRH